MRRGPKPAKSKEAKPPIARKRPKEEGAKVRDLEKRLAEALRRENEGQEQQAATAEILRVISNSPADAAPVFDAIAVNALRLCDAQGAVVVRYDGQLLHMVAQHNVNSEADDRLKRRFPMAPDRHHAMGRAVLDGSVVQVVDLQTTPEFTGSIARQFGARGQVVIPLLLQGRAIGAIGISRSTLGPFPESQIALLQTFADQAVIAVENVRLFNETKEALEQQTATSEILRVISQSHTDVQPVFDTIADSAIRLFRAWSVAVHRYDGELMQIGARRGGLPDSEDLINYRSPRRPSAKSPLGRAILERAVHHEADAQSIPDGEAREVARVRGFRTIMAAPMLRDGEPVGVIGVTRREVRPFTDAEIELLKTFADQAVIAIENVRLFTELQEKNQALTQAHAKVTESLEQQTATSEILRVISASPTEVQPVFDAIVRNAVTLCGALWGTVWRCEGDAFDLVGHHNLPSEELEELPRVLPVQKEGRGDFAIIRTGAVSNLSDIESASEVSPAMRSRWRRRGVRSALTVPMLRENEVVGAIGVSHREPGAFSPSHVELLKTFADQAVIAIENVRLFKQLEARNRDLTATSAILQVISSSPTDAQPVFDAIAQSALRLCEGSFSNVIRYDGDLLHHVAGAHVTPAGADVLRQVFPLRPSRATLSGRVVLDRVVVHVRDMQTDPDYMRTLAEAMRVGSGLAVPMLREGQAVGCIAVGRFDVRPFTDEQVALLQTFADQAVIAIENVRLFKELQASNRDLTTALEQQTATSEILQTIAQAQTDVQPVFDAIVRSAAQLCHAHTTGVFLTDGQVVYHPASYGETPEALATSKARYPRPLDKETAAGTAILTRSAMHVPDIEEPSATAFVRQTGRLLRFRSVLSVPMLRQGEAIGAINVTRRKPGPFSDAEVALLHTFADQAVIAIENVRLFKELESANRDLAAASQHKSEFLANMSHELRTPLNAIIGFSEVLSEKMFGELNEKQEEYLKDIYASGTHLLSLINDILDLSKIEAGRMELELTDFHLPTALDSALTLVRERAGRRGIALQMNVDSRLGQIRADERKVRQVVLNLLSNAIKFTPEGGRIEVGAAPRDRLVEISVSDTGVGIAPEDQEAVFEEFRQVGTADKKVEGTGLGLTLCRKFVELHGGRIWVKSEVGQGSTFTFTLPVRRGE